MSHGLIVSVSGMRGVVGTDLTPELVVRHAAALGAWASANGNVKVVLGRDARTSGPMFTRAAEAGLMSVGSTIIDLGVVPTPTVQLAVGASPRRRWADSHRQPQPHRMERAQARRSRRGLPDAESGAAVRSLAEQGPPRADWSGLGHVTTDPTAIDRHLDQLLSLPIIDVEAIRNREFHVALDCVRGAGGAIIPALLERLGCKVSAINLETDGRFPRAPEPVPENLTDLGALVRESGADIGLAVDPDVDRLALVDETGTPIGEDYTLAFAVQSVLSGNGKPSGTPVVVANLSTSLVVEDAALSGGAVFERAPVGEANVAQAIRQLGAVVGG